MSRTLFLFLFFVFQTIGFAQQPFQTKQAKLNWLAADTLQLDGKQLLARLQFDNARYDDAVSVHPFFVDYIHVYDQDLLPSVQIKPLIVRVLSVEELNLVDISVLDTVFKTTASILVSREQPILQLTVLPMRRVVETGVVEQLIDFEYSIFLEPNTRFKDDGPSFAENSVLASGGWYKIRINQNGIFQITYADLQAMGFNPASLNPNNIRLYGNGGGPLPENNASFRHDDLVENPIFIVGGEDGVFNNSDYILFYGQGPLHWEFNSGTGFYDHKNSYYDDYAYYFITTNLGEGKRIQSIVQPTSTTGVITEFLDYKVAEQDLENLSNTGRTWYGELFDVTLSRDFAFSFPNSIPTRNARLAAEVAGRSFGSAFFQLFIDNDLKRTLVIEPTQATGYDWAKGASAQLEFVPSMDNMTVNLKFNRSINSARGWLDYIAVNVWRRLVYTGPQMIFGNTKAPDNSAFYEYQIQGANGQVSIWDITEPTNVSKIDAVTEGTLLKFNADGSVRRKFIAFENNSFKSIELVSSVANQNLHQIRDIDYLIVAHPDFLSEANRLAELHRANSGLTVFVTTPQLIYNEFSSGAQDITGIRDFARMLYAESSQGKKLRYLLLFGDASFDYKNKLTFNTNFVPTFETIPSLNLVNSIATDDYFGYLDINEGTSNKNLLDIGIGRFPVSTPQLAKQMVDKVIHYISKDETVMSSWRNEITFVADDGDSNRHLLDAEDIAGLIAIDNPDFNLEKIYLDAYKQVATPSGQKAPDVNEAINKRMERGTLIMNYSGHGGEVGWTEERILEISDINGWANRHKMAVFITATCEFSRYDDPTRLSAGEMVFLNPYGGAIAMFTTARATYASTNLRLNRAIFNNNIFTREDGVYPRFGDVIRRSKLNGDDNDRKFVLLGDPALHISFPYNKVHTSHINGNPVGAIPDTLKALDIVTINGFVTDEYDQPLNNFNGVLSTSVFDKMKVITTYGDQNPSTTFNLRNSVIYKGKVEVVNGQFEFSFMMPKDIAYRYGNGRISYYATDYQIDAQGFYEGFIVGGNSNNTVADQNGPQIQLFIGDTNFVNGGFTSENPELFALLADESGINTTGAGIGHDIVATITGATERYAIMNEFYVATLNESSKGSVTYPFANLNPGRHTLTMKAWDILNNSSETSIDFVVIPESEITIDELMNYPNPMQSETYFVFNHNQSGNELNVEIQIFSINGQKIKTIRNTNFSDTYRAEPIRWDGTSDGGAAIAKGLYIYRLIVTNSNGNQTEKRSKLLYY